MAIKRIKLFSGLLRNIFNVPDYEKIIEVQAGQEAFGETVIIGSMPYKKPRENKRPENGISKQLNLKKHINWPK